MNSYLIIYRILVLKVIQFFIKYSQIFFEGFKEPFETSHYSDFKFREQGLETIVTVMTESFLFSESSKHFIFVTHLYAWHPS